MKHESWTQLSKSTRVFMPWVKGEGEEETQGSNAWAHGRVGGGWAVSDGTGGRGPVLPSHEPLAIRLPLRRRVVFHCMMQMACLPRAQQPVDITLAGTRMGHDGTGRRMPHGM